VEQAATIGELHHSIEANLMTKDGVHPELGEVVASRKPGRLLSGEVNIFDSNGVPQRHANQAIHARYALLAH